jgi:dolichol-phosphate mannosyltransferase
MRLRIKRPELLKRLAKFATVGTTGVGVNLGVLYLLTGVAGMHYAASAFVAIEASIIFNFYFNDQWTFKDRRGTKLLPRLIKFNAVAGVGVGLNMALMVLLVEVLGLHYLLAEFMAIVCVFAWNYILSSKLVWRKNFMAGSIHG